MQQTTQQTNIQQDKKGSGMNKGLFTLAMIAAAALLFLAVNVFSNVALTGVQVDLTEEGLYTLSDGTRSVLSKIEEPVTLRFYYSERLGREVPSYGTYATRVQELLRQYDAIGGDKLRLEIHHPEPFSEEEDRAVAYGLQGVPVDETGEKVFFGLAGTNALDGLEVIEFFQSDREASLEYDITKMVHSLATVEKPVVGLLSTLPVMGGPGGMSPFGTPQMQQPWVIIEQLQQLFETETLDTDIRVIPEDIKILMLIHPHGLSDATLYAIDQFVMRGGRLAVFLDPYSEAAAQAAGMGPRAGMAPDAGQTSSDLGKLLEAWGVAFDPTQVAGDREAAQRVSAGAGTALQAVDYIAWMSLRDENLSREDFITADLSHVNVASAGVLAPARQENAAEAAEAAEAEEAAGSAAVSIDFEPLLTTGPQSMTFPASKLEGMPDPLALLNDFQPGGEKLTLAARVSGPLKSAFPDGPPPPPVAEDGTEDNSAIEDDAPSPRPEDHLAKTEAEANLILFADTDLLQDRSWVRVQNFFGQRVAVPNASNNGLVVNAIENLSGSNDLISLRSRGVSQRPFEVIEDMRREAENRFRAEEERLMARLEETERKLEEIRAGEGASGAHILTPEQRQAIDGFKTEILNTRKQLRSVQRALRDDIETAQARLRAINIALVPVLIGLVAIGLALFRSARRRRTVRD